MTTLWWQYLIIWAGVLVSALYMVRKLAPGGARKAQATLAQWCARSGSAPLQALGRRLAPPRQAASCGSGGCDGCDAAAGATPPIEQVVTLQRPAKRR